MKLGIVGLPNVGKSTLFNALTNAKAQSENYPFCTIEPNVGVVCVPDERLNELVKIYNPKKSTPATIEFVDIAGLAKGASKGEGLGNKFLANIREVDAIIHVVRCFENGDIVHVNGNINPKRDIDTINYELILSDIEILDRKIDKTKKLIKSDKSYVDQLNFFEKLKKVLNEGKKASTLECTKDEENFLKEVSLLSNKPVIYAANLSEEDFSDNIENNENYKKVCKIAKEENSSVLPICAQIEAEIAQLTNEEKELFLADMNLKESGLNRLICESYKLLGLISYLTAGEDEVRAWTIKKGTKAPAAAGKIHTDFERGFIRAEVINFSEFIKFKSIAKAKEKGLVRLEGKDYIVQDGDIVLFRFNV